MSSKETQRPARLDCWWSLNPATSNDGVWQSIDFILHRISWANGQDGSVDQHLAREVTQRGSLPDRFHLAPDIISMSNQPAPMSKFVSDLVTNLEASEGPGNVQEWALGKLLAPRTSGYLVRADVIPLRLIDCPDVVDIICPLQPRQHFSALGESEGISTTPSFEATLCHAIAGVQVRASSQDTCESILHRLSDLEAELKIRLSFPWILKDLLPKQILVMVRGALRPPEYGGTGCNVYSAAQALGIGLVVLDRPGHWLQDSKYSDLVDCFIPLDIERNAGLPERVVAALSQYVNRIDGITTFFETYLPFVALAARQLGLPTEPSDALTTAADKYLTSIAAGHAAVRVSSCQDLQTLLSTKQLQYPVIVKPCTGWSSEGVVKASDEIEVVAAVRFTLHDSYVIEEYCDGPEVDANLVLLDGELLFWDISDDFPKSGDGAGGLSCNFAEVANVVPSNLPLSELRVLRQSLHQTLLKLGFRSGMFHLEARVKDSAMKYKVAAGHIVDMTPRTDAMEAGQLRPSPSCWLIEINARPPGIQASEMILGAYGIDYVALGLLMPLRDEERVRSLVVPYSQSPQYWSELVFIAAERGGVFASEDVCESLKKRKPELAAHISSSRCFMKKGEPVPPPSSDATVWVAFFIVFSRTNRRHVLELAEEVRSSTDVLIVD